MLIYPWLLVRNFKRGDLFVTPVLRSREEQLADEAVIARPKKKDAGILVEEEKSPRENPAPQEKHKDLASRVKTRLKKVSNTATSTAGQVFSYGTDFVSTATDMHNLNSLLTPTPFCFFTEESNRRHGARWWWQCFVQKG